MRDSLCWLRIGQGARLYRRGLNHSVAYVREDAVYVPDNIRQVVLGNIMADRFQILPNDVADMIFIGGKKQVV